MKDETQKHKLTNDNTFLNNTIYQTIPETRRTQYISTYRLNTIDTE